MRKTTAWQDLIGTFELRPFFNSENLLAFFLIYIIWLWFSNSNIQVAQWQEGRVIRRYVWEVRGSTPASYIFQFFYLFFCRSSGSMLSMLTICSIIITIRSIILQIQRSKVTAPWWTFPSVTTPDPALARGQPDLGFGISAAHPPFGFHSPIRPILFTVSLFFYLISFLF